MENKIALRPSYWASVSGGKDSLYMLKLILSNPDKYPLDGVVHFELEIDYPFITDVIDYMETECKKHGIKFLRIKPRVKWIDLYNKYGFPTRKVRWCNSKYKLDSLKQLDEILLSNNQYAIHYIGYCADEKERFEKRKDGTITEIYPLVDFDIYERSILEWAKTVPIFNDYYKYNDRCGCMFCPLASRKNIAYLAKFYPSHFEMLIKLMAETEKKRKIELGRPFAVMQSNPKYNAEYIKNNVLTKFLPKLEKQIESEVNTNE